MVFKAARTGRLFFCVNDVTCYLCPSGPWFFYENNEGTARIRVTEVSPQ